MAGVVWPSRGEDYQKKDYERKDREYDVLVPERRVYLLVAGPCAQSFEPLLETGFLFLGILIHAGILWVLGPGVKVFLRIEGIRDKG